MKSRKPKVPAEPAKPYRTEWLISAASTTPLKNGEQFRKEYVSAHVPTDAIERFCRMFPEFQQHHIFKMQKVQIINERIALDPPEYQAIEDAFPEDGEGEDTSLLD